MIYFINEYLMALNSGIEHAEIKRLAMFKHQGVPAKLVTRDFDQMLYANKQRFGIEDDQIINMYDFFQGITKQTPLGQNEPKLAALNLAPDYNIDPGADVTHVSNGDQLVMDVHFAPGTVGQLYRVDVFDQTGHIVQASLWDFRGFKSREQFFNTTGQLVGQITYNPAGERVIEEYFSQDQNGQSYVSLIQLVNYQDQDLFFNSYDELFTFFLDELNREANGAAIFIADRPGTAYEALLAMTAPVKRFITVPTTHTVDVKDQVYANLAGIYANPLVNQIEKLTGVIVATESQKRDLTRWMGGEDRVKAPISVVPFSTVDETRIQSVTLEQRTQHKVIVVGRLTKERHVQDVVSAFINLRKKVPDATLDIYGYGDQEASIKQQIEAAELTDVITLKGYVVDLEDVYNDAQVYVNATESDSDPLALTEALAHGVPSVVYNVHYGPGELITDGDNGYLVAAGDINGLTQAMRRTLRHDDQWQKMSQAAYISSQSRSEKSVYAQWQAALMI